MREPAGLISGDVAMLGPDEAVHTSALERPNISESLGHSLHRYAMLLKMLNHSVRRVAK